MGSVMDSNIPNRTDSYINERNPVVSDPAILALITVIFLALGYAGVPIAFALMAGVLVGGLFTPVSLLAIVRQMFSGIDVEALIAVPFFLLVGELLSSTGIVIRIVNLSKALVGHMRGGFGQVVVVFSMFFSEMSGSTTADVAVMSRTLSKPMMADGYKPAFIAALIAGASTIAALVPPSITAVIYGAVGNVSIAGLFMAGIAPALTICVSLMLYCYFFGPVKIQHKRPSLLNVAAAARDAALPIMIPVILLGGILSGWFTPSEAGMVAVMWILFVVIPLLNPKHIRRLPEDFCQAGLIYSVPLITIAAAAAFGWMVSYLRAPQAIAGWITDFAGNNPYLIMFTLVLLFVVICDFIEPVPTIIIFTPLVQELTTIGQINPVHMGVTLITTLAFGLITPPYGLVLLMASKIVGVRFSSALRAALPIYAIFFMTITLEIFFPNVVLYLPKLMMPQTVGCFPDPNGTGFLCP